MRPIKSLLVLVFARASGNAVSAVRPWDRGWGSFGPFSYPEPILRAVNGARQGALAKSISNWHLIGYNEGYCSNTGYILLPCFHGIRLWIWPEPLVAPRVRRALGTRMVLALLLGNPLGLLGLLPPPRPQIT